MSLFSENFSHGTGANWQLWKDDTDRNGPEHMGLDEALLLTSSVPILRFYQWSRPELTLGFFTPFAASSDFSPLPTRRWTGGGVVEHGEDITFALAIPRVFLRETRATASSRYRFIHEALAAALIATGIEPALAASPPSIQSKGPPGQPGTCFTEPVPWDLMSIQSGRKMAGGAQRRSKAGLLHQGSVRLPEENRSLDHPWITQFSESLFQESGHSIRSIKSPSRETAETAAQLTRDRYRNSAWLERF